MKRFFLFYGYIHYPSGGMDDFKGSFDTFEEAKESLDNLHGIENDWLSHWGQIYDIVEGKMVWTNSYCD